MTELFTFPKDFQWGTATSSFQIEGASHEDGRNDSIWDVFCRQPGAIVTGDNADTACDHYHLWKDDISRMQQLGIKAYRFSLAWPRILPEGRGKPNQAGIDFYDRLIDGLLEAGILPLITLYHWDLPVSLTRGWQNRSTVFAFTEYAGLAASVYGDRVKNWITINEPFCASFLGYAYGIHAPGMQDISKALTAAHHLLLSHGLAVPIIRSICPEAKVGIATNHSPIYAHSSSAADSDAARHADGELNRWFLDPLYDRGYPADMVADYHSMGVLATIELDFVKPGDLEAIAVDTDFLGVNYYSRNIVQAVTNHQNPFANRAIPSQPENQTDIGWEIFPDGLYEILTRLYRDYAPEKMIITENGASYADGPDEHGRVGDDRRIDYLREHISAVGRAIQGGVPVAGYYLWSFMDNFEWSYGFSQRFGIVYVDFNNQKRYPKDSAFWYKRLIEQNGLALELAGLNSRKERFS